MIKENSGKFYRFKLEHNMGFGIAEVYDFTDLSLFDGRVVYVYKNHHKEERVNYELSEMRSSGTALGPIRLNKFPNTRGLHAWKFLFQTKDLLIKDLPVIKELQGLHWKDDNWDNFKGKWHSSDYNIKKELPTYVAYDKVRNLETRILNHPTNVVRKFTMKIILDQNEKISDYYDLSELGNKFLFVQLVNTYYPLSKTKSFLKQLPKVTSMGG